MGRPRRRHRHRAVAHHGARDHRVGSRAQRVHRPGDHRLRGLQGRGAAVDARTRRSGHGSPGRRHPRDGPCVRDRAARHDLLDAGHHRAPQRRRQRPLAHQPGAAHRSRGRWGSGINPLRGQNNVQGGGDMGALPDRLPGFQHVENDEARARFDRAWGVAVPPRRGWHLTGMFDAMERGELKALYVIGENPAQSEADQHRTSQLLRGLDVLVVQDVMHSATAALADVALPAAAGAFESEGTVTSSERRVQRVRRVKAPVGESRDDLAIIFDLARRLGADWGRARRRTGVGRAARAVAGARRHELRAPRPRPAGCSGPVTTTRTPARRSCTAGCGNVPSAARGRPSRSWRTHCRSRRSTTTTRCASRPDAGWRSTTPACRPAATPRRCAAAKPSTCRPRTPPALGLSEGAGRARAVAARRGRGAGAHRPGPAARAHLHDLPFPRRRGHQPS